MVNPLVDLSEEEQDSLYEGWLSERDNNWPDCDDDWPDCDDDDWPDCDDYQSCLECPMQDACSDYMGEE